MTAALAHIFLRPGARVPVRRVASAEAIADRGLVGDHASGGTRQVTLLDLGAWRRACAELGVDLDPAARRANLVLDGLELRGATGRRLRIGAVVLELGRETRPCELLYAAHVGLCQSLRAEWRGGVGARVLSSGTLALGDLAQWDDAAPA